MPAPYLFDYHPYSQPSTSIPRYYMVYHCWNSLQEENYQLGNSSVVSKFIPGKEHTDKTSLSFSTGLSQSSAPSILFNPRLNKIFNLCSNNSFLCVQKIRPGLLSLRALILLTSAGCVESRLVDQIQKPSGLLAVSRYSS